MICHGIDLSKFKNKVDLNNKNPIETFELIKQNLIDEKEMKICIYILSTLHSIERVINDFFNKQYIYIQSDDSVKYIIEMTLNIKIDTDQFEKCLFILDFSKLIYRFTCAKKFKINDSSINQFRINSWGNEYYTNLVNDKEKEKSFYNYFKKYCLDNVLLYNELISLLSIPITDENAYKIASINKLLSLKLLI